MSTKEVLRAVTHSMGEHSHYSSILPGPGWYLSSPINHHVQKTLCELTSYGLETNLSHSSSITQLEPVHGQILQAYPHIIIPPAPVGEIFADVSEALQGGNTLSDFKLAHLSQMDRTLRCTSYHSPVELWFLHM